MSSIFAMAIGSAIHGAAFIALALGPELGALSLWSARAPEPRLVGVQDEVVEDSSLMLWKGLEELDGLQPDVARAADLREQLTRAIAEHSGELSPAQLGLAHRTARSAALWLEFEGAGGALALQEQLHQKVAADWTAMNLSLSLERVGNFERAEAVLEAQMQRSGASPVLLTRQGLGLIGRGAIRAGRARLSIAMALGSDDAEITLARLDLSSGRRQEALRGFAAVLSRSDTGAWSRRGYGMALLGPDPVLVGPAPAIKHN